MYFFQYCWYTLDLIQNCSNNQLRNITLKILIQFTAWFIKICQVWTFCIRAKVSQVMKLLLIAVLPALFTPSERNFLLLEYRKNIIKTLLKPTPSRQNWILRGVCSLNIFDLDLLNPLKWTFFVRNFFLGHPVYTYQFYLKGEDLLFLNLKNCIQLNF